MAGGEGTQELRPREVEIIKGILDDGVKEGVFSMPDTDITALVLHHALKGLEVPISGGSWVIISASGLNVETM